MSDQIGLNLNHVQDKITRVEVSMARVEVTTEDSNKRLTEVQTEVKHAVKNMAAVSQAVTMIGEKVRIHEDKIDKLEKGKADAEDLNSLRDQVEAGKKHLMSWAGRVALWVGGAIMAYVISKLGITIPHL
uniref:hypothetical protein n=1 Tax=Methylobacterium sp. B34 TaxID=95563 RepID=UPI00034C5152|nr:hypothetical protein [Methylobacterium sp. B34]